MITHTKGFISNSLAWAPGETFIWYKGLRKTFLKDTCTGSYQGTPSVPVTPGGRHGLVLALPTVKEGFLMSLRLPTPILSPVPSWLLLQSHSLPVHESDTQQSPNQTRNVSEFRLISQESPHTVRRYLSRSYWINTKSTQ